MILNTAKKKKHIKTETYLQQKIAFFQFKHIKKHKNLPKPKRHFKIRFILPLQDHNNSGESTTALHSEQLDNSAPHALCQKSPHYNNMRF